MKKSVPIILILFLKIGFLANAQQIPNATPSASLKQQLGISEFTIAYRRPNVQQRQIRTGNTPVLPDHKVWNTSITITSNTEFAIDSKYLDAGKYTLSAIPEPLNWVLIFKKIDEQTDDQVEVLRVFVKQETSGFTETLETRLTNVTDSTALVSILWDTFSIPVKVTVPTNALVLKSYQQALLNNHSGHGNTLQYGAWYLLTRSFELPLALEWIQKDISHKETYYNTWLKAQLLRKLNKTDEALNAAQSALDLALVSSDIDFGTYVPRIRNALEFWSKTPGSALTSVTQ